MSWDEKLEADPARKTSSLSSTPIFAIRNKTRKLLLGGSWVSATTYVSRLQTPLTITIGITYARKAKIKRLVQVWLQARLRVDTKSQEPPSNLLIFCHFGASLFLPLTGCPLAVVCWDRQAGCKAWTHMMTIAAVPTAAINPRDSVPSSTLPPRETTEFSNVLLDLFSRKASETRSRACKLP